MDPLSCTRGGLGNKGELEYSLKKFGDASRSHALRSLRIMFRETQHFIPSPACSLVGSLGDKDAPEGPAGSRAIQREYDNSGRAEPRRVRSWNLSASKSSPTVD